MWRLKNEWYSMRKRDKACFAIILITIIFGLIYGLVYYKTGYTISMPVVEHTIAECQHEEVTEVNIALKEIYGEDSRLRYALRKTLNCTTPITLTVDAENIIVYIKDMSPEAQETRQNNAKLIAFIVSCIFVGIPTLMFIGSCIFVKAFSKKSEIARATVINIIVEENAVYSERKREYLPILIYEYEYRDREYIAHTGKTKSFYEYAVGDTLDILYLRDKPSISFNQQMFHFLKFAPWILLIVVMAASLIGAPAIMNYLL